MDRLVRVRNESKDMKMAAGKKSCKVLLLCKEGKESAEIAIDYLSQVLGDELMVFKGSVGTPLPAELDQIEFDCLVSYLSPWIIPEHLLEKAGKAAINFHPAPPEYPGIGCFNFALYDDVDVYGATCHHMAPAVDSGDVIDVARFKVFSTDSVLSLSQKTYAHMLALFFNVIDSLLQGEELPISSEKWTRKPYTRKELEELCRITPVMSESELRRRIRATTYPGMPGPRMYLHGYTFNIDFD